MTPFPNSELGHTNSGFSHQREGGVNPVDRGRATLFSKTVVWQVGLSARSFRRARVKG
jgi:hypothetical protein